MLSDATPSENRYAKRAAMLSLVLSVVLLLVKFWAFRITRSQAVFSDAMETIANVAASTVALVVLNVAHKPADKDHPYGHGKVEFFSAAFEGGLITFASIMICVAAIMSLVRGASIEKIGIGLLVTIGTGLVNAALGFFLLRAGRKTKSLALEASGYHVLSDFWTSVGVVGGLWVVQLTGLQWIDPTAALVVGIYLGWTGVSLVRRSVGGLLDAEDRGILENLLRLVGRDRPSGIIQLHHLRVIRSGSYHHIDAHCVVPEFWDVAEAHDHTAAFEAKLMRDYPYPGELHLHVDPCRRAYCSECDLPSCPIRRQSFVARRELSIEELTHPEEPPENLSQREGRLSRNMK